MKSSKIALLILLYVLVAGCGGSGGGGSPTATLISIAVTPTNPSIPVGVTKQFTATGTYSDGTIHDISTQVTWNSPSPSVATVNSSGLATALATGTATITATSGTISGSTTLTVTAAMLSSISLAPVNPRLFMGNSLQLTAFGTYSDGTSHDVSTQVTWSSSNSSTSVATVDSGGLATAVAAGSTTITAASGNVWGTTILTVTVAATGDNVLPITVNGSLCASNSYLNKPCVSVTVCTPDTATCQTIDDIVLDTGSYGLRIFRQVLTDVSLTQVPSGSGSLAECVQFADGSADWGPVQTADVILGNEPAVQVPIQVIDSTFFNTFGSSACGTLDESPSQAGFNGILGVGLFAEDCGSGCASSTSNGRYYTCSGSNCTGAKVPLLNQVQNPVALLPLDNNGVIVQLPSIALSGSPSVNGSLVLGISTQSNNAPSGVTAFPASRVGRFTTTFNDTLYSSFIDSGSNGLFFPSTSQLPNCSHNPDWFCPSSTINLSATNTGASGSPSGVVSFQIANLESLLLNPSSNAFPDIGGNFPIGFDWGLPFFFGRNVHVGIDGKDGSSLGTGPFWAY
jgi:hypothetical protein